MGKKYLKENRILGKLFSSIVERSLPLFGDISLGGSNWTGSKHATNSLSKIVQTSTWKITEKLGKQQIVQSSNWKILSNLFLSRIFWREKVGAFAIRGFFAFCSVAVRNGRLEMLFWWNEAERKAQKSLWYWLLARLVAMVAWMGLVAFVILVAVNF